MSGVFLSAMCVLCAVLLVMSDPWWGREVSAVAVFICAMLLIRDAWLRLRRPR